MMINTEKFIKEVRLNECIWNTQAKQYNNKITRRNAWKDIVEKLNPDLASTTTAEERYKLRINYAKKWKNIKDYYYRCKFKSTEEKKRKPPYFGALSFLDVIKESKDTSCNVNCEYKTESIGDHTDNDHVDVEDPLVYQGNDDQCEEESSTTKSSSPEPTYRRRTNIKKIKQIKHKQIRSRDQDEEECNSNKHFLLSLLADMDKIDDDQNLDFRVSVMNIVKNIKNKPNFI